MYKLLDRESNTHTVTANFNDVLAAKGMTKLPSLKRVYRTGVKDRMCYVFPCYAAVAKMLGVTAWPAGKSTWDDFETVSSSWQSTMEYITAMYGKKYAQGFERADYPQLRKAA
jgi:hypothetical protein